MLWLLLRWCVMRCFFTGELLLARCSLVPSCRNRVVLLGCFLSWRVRIAHKSYTLRQALSHNTTERKCNRPNCPIEDTNLCLQRITVYQLTCKACGEYYIGSTTRFLHDRTKEHLANDNSSVKKHLITQHCNNNHNIELKVITRENDPVNLRLHVAYYIRKYKPGLNSREECAELNSCGYTCLLPKVTL